MYFMTTVRTGFTICVPLFLVLSGYLLNKKKLSPQYYKGIVRILIIYVLSAVCCLFYKKYMIGTELSLKSCILGILDFSAANYSWYVEMYIGLFLMIPFLNLMYNGLGSKRQKQALVLTFLALTALPTLTNTFDLITPGWWQTPAISSDYTELLPDWWAVLYPISYYFIGAYLSEYGLPISSKRSLLLYLLSTVVFGLYNSYRSYNAVYQLTLVVNWRSFENVITTTFFFWWLASLRCRHVPEPVCRITAWISRLSFGTYLVSWIFDSVFYPRLKQAVPEITDRFPYYFLIVPAVFLCSLALSLAMEAACTGILLLFSGICKRFRTS